MRTPGSDLLNGFFEGDLVECNLSHLFNGPGCDRMRWLITNTVLHVTDFTTISLGPLFGSGELTTPLPPDRIRLVRRGNLFRHLYATGPLEFRDIAAEATFWRRQLLLHELRNPANNLLYSWTLDQAIEALRAGTADGFFASSGIAGLPGVFFGGYTFKGKMPDVAARMREACLLELSTMTQQELDSAVTI